MAVGCLLSLSRFIEYGLFSVTSNILTSEQRSLAPAGQRVHCNSFIFGTGFSGAGSAVPLVPVVWLLSIEFAVLCQIGTEIVYQKFTF